MVGLKGAKSPHQALYFYENYHLVAERQGKWKLVLPGAGPKAKKGPKERELFDLEADLGQTKNLAAAQPAIVQRLLTVVEAARDDLGDDASKPQGKNRRPAGTAK